MHFLHAVLSTQHQASAQPHAEAGELDSKQMNGCYCHFPARAAPPTQSCSQVLRGSPRRGLHCSNRGLRAPRTADLGGGSDVPGGDQAALFGPRPVALTATPAALGSVSDGSAGRERGAPWLSSVGTLWVTPLEIRGWTQSARSSRSTEAGLRSFPTCPWLCGGPTPPALLPPRTSSQSG